jgi:hypothetical protein
MNSPKDCSKERPIHARRGGIVSSAEIIANIEASGIEDDSDKTPVTGLRDAKWLDAHKASGKRVGDE